ncbi:hypothetical protein QYE76_012847 [Lolium multiflorum]|uniref:F-box/LRR-repeat protein 15/At3g58940/PEG3-like LRR domain-containing protein n=1 Tax=Lolium multiflorum TaxID=4521 RepID=A0AAD8U1W3_LOLMU|nr:hypothetical protein QYE76_012847 [Lolium multiflorum]
MEMDAGGSRSRKRKSAGLDPDEAAAPAAEGHGPEPADEDQEPPLPAAGGGGEDLISHLPDDVLGDIITLLPTKEGALTSLLASRWRHLWSYAPLNLDHRGLRKEVKDLAALVSRILSAHKGPVRRFCVPLLYDNLRQVATVEAWIRSPAFRNLQELDMCRFGFQYAHLWPKPVPATAAFCFSGTLCAATIADCHVPDITAQAIHFPKLKKLELDHVTISESSLRTVLTGCLALDCLLIAHSYGFRRVQINSISLYV